MVGVITTTASLDSMAKMESSLSQRWSKTLIKSSRSPQETLLFTTRELSTYQTNPLCLISNVEPTLLSLKSWIGRQISKTSTPLVRMTTASAVTRTLMIWSRFPRRFNFPILWPTVSQSFHVEVHTPFSCARAAVFINVEGFKMSSPVYFIRFWSMSLLDRYLRVFIVVRFRWITCSISGLIWTLLTHRFRLRT